MNDREEKPKFWFTETNTLHSTPCYRIQTWLDVEDEETPEEAAKAHEYGIAGAPELFRAFKAEPIKGELKLPGVTEYFKRLEEMQKEENNK